MKIIMTQQTGFHESKKCNNAIDIAVPSMLLAAKH